MSEWLTTYNKYRSQCRTFSEAFLYFSKGTTIGHSVDPVRFSPAPPVIPPDFTGGWDSGCGLVGVVGVTPEVTRIQGL